MPSSKNNKSINGNVLGLCEVDGFCPWEFFDLDENSFVVDLGAFRGDFSQYILDKYNCRVDAYEPINFGCYLVNHPKFRLIKEVVFDGREVFFNRESESPGGHIFSQAGELVKTIDIRDIVKEHIDLLKVNIEGAEVQALRVADLSNVDQILVEFHLFMMKDKEEAMKEIRETINHIMSFKFQVKQINESGPAFLFYGKIA